MDVWFRFRLVENRTDKYQVLEKKSELALTRSSGPAALCNILYLFLRRFSGLIMLEHIVMGKLLLGKVQIMDHFGL